MHGKIAQNFVTLILSVADRRDDVATIEFKLHSVVIQGFFYPSDLT